MLEFNLRRPLKTFIRDRLPSGWVIRAAVSAVTCLEGVAGQGDVGEGDNLAVALPHLKVLEEHQRWGWLEGLPLKLPTHHYLHSSHVGCCGSVAYI